MSNFLSEEEIEKTKLNKFDKLYWKIIVFCHNREKRDLWLKERFKIKLSDGSLSADYYRLTKFGLQIHSELTDDWHSIKGIEKILSGEVEIVKMPFIPRLGDGYYLLADDNHHIKVIRRVWRNSEFDFQNYKNGNCYEAEDIVEGACKKTNDELFDELFIK